MLAVGRDVDTVRGLVAADVKGVLGHTDIACINAPQITVVSGPVAEIEHLKATLDEGGSRATVLRVPYGFHSHHIEPILGDFTEIAKSVVFSSPHTPVASTLLGRVVDSGEHGVFSPSYLARQARESVNFRGAMEAYQAHSLSSAKPKTCWIELGPDPICIGLVRRCLEVLTSNLLPTMKAAEDNWITISSTLASLYEAGLPHQLAAVLQGV